MDILILELIRFAVFIAASVAVVVVAFTLVTDLNAKFTAGVIGALLVLAIYSSFSQAPPWFIGLLWLIAIAKAVIIGVENLRRSIISGPTLKYFRRVLPEMSSTEREALEAGTVWWEAELFSGKPDWNKLIDADAPHLTEEEQAFIDGPVEQFCEMVDDWQIISEDYDLTAEAWNFLRQQGFFGMIIPKRYGGLEFSAYAHSCIVLKIASRSTTAGTTSMVPNSLGPGLLLLEYGTQEQRDYYLPRLADGREIPCFALTGPEAGSDAAGMPDYGVVCRQQLDGEETLGIRLNWNKRYITLAPVATVMGLAFKLFDPDHLLGEEEDLGITVALIPTDTQGVEIGERHLPLNSPFMNGPIRGKDVFIGMDRIIGGQPYIGQGWRMLMESLSDGRGISLPSLSAASGKFLAMHTGAYARIREQFNVAIGEFEGVQTGLADIAGNAYLMDGVRSLTAATIDRGEKPAVASAIAKYHLTERMRTIVDHATDIHGGSAICMGPRNAVGRIYQSVPIGITVEGANILTRSLIIFGQGSVRCHPWIYKEMQAAAETDETKALADFDNALTRHIALVLTNMGRSLLGGIYAHFLSDAPTGRAETRYYRRLSRLSANFALISDIMMSRYGGDLKRLEYYSGLLGDMLSYLYMASATLKHFQNRGSSPDDKILLNWSLHECTRCFHSAMIDLLDNRPIGILTPLVSRFIYPLGRPKVSRRQKLDRQAAQIILQKSELRDSLIAGIFIPKAKNDPIAKVERAFATVLAGAEPERKYKRLQKQLSADDADFDSCMAQIEREQLMTTEEISLVRHARAARLDVIQVDHFGPDYFQRRQPTQSTPDSKPQHASKRTSATDDTDQVATAPDGATESTTEPDVTEPT